MKKTSVGKIIMQLTAAGALVGAATTASAGEGEWEFALSPLFLWGLSLDGDATIDGMTAPLDLAFEDEILDNMEAVFTLHFEARRDDLILFAEYQFVDLEPEVEAAMGPVSANVDIDFEESLLELGLGLTFSESESTRWELIGGARYTDQDVDIDVTLTPAIPNAPGQTVKISGGDDWWHAFGGIRVAHSFTERWSFIGRADYGYSGKDDSATNLVFMFDYRFRDWGSAFIGGRWLNYDYESGSYDFNAMKQGPIAGITLHW